MNFLTRIRSKPPLVRAQYALAVAGVITGIVTLMWLSTLPTRFAKLGEIALPDANTESVGGVRQQVEDVGPETPSIEAEALGSLRMDSVSTTTTSTPPLGTATTSNTPRVIQIGTTSQTP